MTRVLIADDDDLMRAGLVELLTVDPGIEIAGQAATGRAAVTQARRLSPDVVPMDVRMPDLDGIGATRELVVTAPDTKVLILTTFSSRMTTCSAPCAPVRPASCSNGRGPRS
jgi:DNA-binding NarL/FixJ family response regulator